MKQKQPLEDINPTDGSTNKIIAKIIYTVRA